MNFEPSDVAAMCKQLGSQVRPLVGLDGATLLWAICMNESSGGVKCGPRYEKAYDNPNNPVMAPLIAEFGGQAAASSYGPMQVMFGNLPRGTNPSDFDDLGKAMTLSIGFLNHELMRFKPVTLTTIGQIWNGGEPMKEPGAGVQAYCAKLCQNYDKGLPS